MLRKFAVLFIFASVNFSEALSAKKVTEGPSSLCIFGVCFSGKKDYDSSIKTHDTRDSTIEELTKRQEELDAWKKEENERKQLEEDEKRAKLQEEKDAVIAQSCQCTWQCGDRNDGTVCFRKCCNNEFGGSGTMAVTQSAAAAPTAPAFPGFAVPAFPAMNPFAALPFYKPPAAAAAPPAAPR
eukprot:gnl/MRDRNA2_/MRDRNA2_29137_c0_seq1.p1 gnl/MRDRNA2_/MRDRNA2_29137_c0~~gnl/MRDRNA2_/MRDRNA2_29137_c0_seq1.p1  ORF type:complete len:183 (+),score=55.83 gnl/MRDRNA2_/MRDRNA2_29137_c0_seq1:113-661(+)